MLRLEVGEGLFAGFAVGDVDVDHPYAGVRAGGDAYAVAGVVGPPAVDGFGVVGGVFLPFVYLRVFLPWRDGDYVPAEFGVVVGGVVDVHSVAPTSKRVRGGSVVGVAVRAVVGALGGCGVPVCVSAHATRPAMMGW